MQVRGGYALILGFVGFVTSFGAHVVAVNLPVYAEQVGAGVAVIGLLVAAYDAAELVAKPVFGFVADHWGMKRTMLLGIVVFTLASLAYLWIDPRLLLAVRFMQGVGAAALSAVSLAMVGLYYTKSRGRAYGQYNALKGAGYVVSPVIGGAIVWRSDFAAIFVVAAAVGALAFLLALLLPDPGAERGAAALEDDDDERSLLAMLAVIRRPALWPWYAVIAINMFFVGILFGFLPVRVHALGHRGLTAGLLVAAATTAYVLVQPAAGALADRLGAEPTIRVGLALSAAGVILVPFVDGVPLLLVEVVAGLGIGAVWTNTDALISSLAQSGRLGATMGMAGSFKEFGDMLGPLLIGVLSQAFGLTAGFVGCGLLGVLALAVLSARTDAKPPPEGGPTPETRSAIPSSC